MRKLTIVNVLDSTQSIPVPAPTTLDTDHGTHPDWAAPDALNSTLVWLGTQSEMSRRAFLASCDDIEPLRQTGFAAVPPVVPSLNGRRIKISPALLYGLFAADPRARWSDFDDESGYHDVPASFSSHLLYRGTRPDQDAGTVLFALVRRQIGQPIGQKIRLSLRSFGKSLTWSDSSNTTSRVLRALHTLASGRASYAWNQEQTVEIGFLRIHDANGTQATVSFDPAFAWAFTGYQTYLDWERRTLLTVGLETWLHDVVKATNCRNAFALHSLHHISGSTKLLKQFSSDLVEAAARLVRFGFVEHCEIDGKPIRASRPDLFRSDIDSMDATSKTALRFDPISYIRFTKTAEDMPEKAASADRSTKNSKPRKKASKEPDHPACALEDEAYCDTDYDESAPNLDDLPSADDDD